MSVNLITEEESETQEKMDGHCRKLFGGVRIEECEVEGREHDNIGVGIEECIIVRPAVLKTSRRCGGTASDCTC